MIVLQIMLNAILSFTEGGDLRALTKRLLPAKQVSLVTI